MRRLPPLASIEAFVHAARTGSVRQAAEAIALSPPALTRRLQTIERHLGKPLFDRRPRRIRLNEEGEKLLAGLSPALDALARAFETARGEEERIRLAVPPLFASARLLRRLPEFRELHPEIHIDLDTAPAALSRLGEGIDAAIILARDVETALHARPIAAGRVIAIGSRGSGLDRPEALAKATILVHHQMPDAFEYWRRAAGLPKLEPAAVDHFDSGQLILDAAAEGLGIAFLFDWQVEAADDPRLVSLFGIAAEFPYRYWFACRRSALKHRPIRRFDEWLAQIFPEPATLAKAA